MAFKKGQPKIGGRQKGSLNKAKSLQEYADALSCNPFEILLQFAKGDHVGLGLRKDEITSVMRLKAATECSQYLYPKRKVIDDTGQLTQQEQIFLQLYRERVAQLEQKTEPTKELEDAADLPTSNS